MFAVTNEAGRITRNATTAGTNESAWVSRRIVTFGMPLANPMEYPTAKSARAPGSKMCAPNSGPYRPRSASSRTVSSKNRAKPYAKANSMKIWPRKRWFLRCTISNPRSANPTNDSYNCVGCTGNEWVAS